MEPVITASDLYDFNTPDQQYTSALEFVAPSITTKIEEQRADDESWADTLQRILPFITATYQQKKILEIQAERAKQGLPPLDQSQFGVGVNVGVSDDAKWLGYAAIGVVALLLLKRR